LEIVKYYLLSLLIMLQGRKKIDPEDKKVSIQVYRKRREIKRLGGAVSARYAVNKFLDKKLRIK
jgi:hypothetical protein